MIIAVLLAELFDATKLKLKYRSKKKETRYNNYGASKREFSKETWSYPEETSAVNYVIGTCVFALCHNGFLTVSDLFVSLVMYRYVASPLSQIACIDLWRNWPSGAMSSEPVLWMGQ